MTIQIAPMAALLILVGLAVGFSVFKYTARTAHGAEGRGDLGTSIAGAAAVVSVLAVLLTPGFGQTATNPVQPPPHPTESAANR
ncbi:hypothetical protein Snoj_39150 [Streptomyces nojiriensis]|uniref:DUF4190 domain-containing protein n=1 Tax=Streptomyces nojiriensis TaxID=66374 RepID=A0ABQ3SPN2_9ACTN|nr:hypothetical protein [Streptomyces nojiriensis]QTI43543.1 hypothetical protein JYK04_01305 [Streptomyces nojiriensis]GGR81730.1 hypothetical protein GCM10010205_07800 [Streptomyces nojiriensis]GHI69997.1 hypothetical protein Snoj_39150 [Streptomyces nojiriensis]